MRIRHRTLFPLLGTRPGPVTGRLRRLRDKLAAGLSAPAVREFCLELNRELLAGGGDEAGHLDMARAADLCLELIEANADEGAAALGALLDGTAIQFDDPLADAIFDAAPRCPALLGALADLVEREHQLLACRVRAVEALVTRSPVAADAATVGLAIQPALRFLN